MRDMDLDRFLNLLATVLGALGSVYTLKGVAALSPDLMERLSRSYWGFSAAQVDALASQKADAIVGIALVVIALVIAVINTAAVPTGVRMFDQWTVGVALVAVLSGAAYITLALVGSAVHRQQKLAVGRIITSQALTEIFNKGRVPASEMGSLRGYGRTLLGLAVEESEAPRDLVQRLATEVGLQVPETLDFSEIEAVGLRQ